ncbi:MAG: flagellar export chaperone FliS [bacterium]|nr:flagellar export chaperone FliS [bacterium]MCP4966859.1 flagellar export chaperone FliS [bacterium]
MTSLAVSYQAAGDAYQSQSVGTAGPLQLVLMLYDRALAAIARSEWALTNSELGSIELAHKELTRAQDIVTELMLSLDHDKGGEISTSLNAIYEFCLERLTQANLNKDATSLPFVTKSLTDLREAWAHIAAESGE